MKILFCTNTFERAHNGPSRFANYLLEVNERFPGVELRILTEDISPANVNAYGGKVVRLALRLNKFTRSWGFIYRMFPYYRACQELRSEYAYDVVIFNNAITGIWAARKLTVPVLGMINDYSSLTVSWRAFDGRWSWFRRYLFKECERWASAVEAGIIVNSEYLRRQVAASYRIPAHRLKLLYKGVDLRNSVAERASPSEAVKVLFVKSDYRLGGLFDLIEALNHCSGFSFELYILGPADRFRNDILSRTFQDHVSPRFIGPVASDQVYEYMADCDLFIVPSHREALGVANIEALFYKIPVISTRVGGIPEVLDHGNNGWLVTPGQPAELADTIRYVLENADERQSKQRNGYQFVRNTFSHEKTLERFVSIVREFV